MNRSPTSPHAWAGDDVLRVAGVLGGILGLGFGIPGIVAIAHFARTGEVWTFMGYPTYGGGPFESHGLKTSVPLLAAFVAVCAAETVDGVLLWRRSRGGVIGSIILVPFELFFWWGFALPFGPLLGIPRTVLAIVGWRASIRASRTRA